MTDSEFGHEFKIYRTAGEIRGVTNAVHLCILDALKFGDKTISDLSVVPNVSTQMLRKHLKTLEKDNLIKSYTKESNRRIIYYTLSSGCVISSMDQITNDNSVFKSCFDEMTFYNVVSLDLQNITFQILSYFRESGVQISYLLNHYIYLAIYQQLKKSGDIGLSDRIDLISNFLEELLRFKMTMSADMSSVTFRSTNAYNGLLITDPQPYRLLKSIL